MVPCFNSSSRESCWKLKMVSAPSRVSDLSLNISSARDCTPVRTLCCPRIVSLSCAGRAPDGSSVLTSRKICVISAWVKAAARSEAGSMTNERPQVRTRIWLRVFMLVFRI